MKFRQDLIKFTVVFFIGLSLASYFSEGTITTNQLIGNAVGGFLGGLVYAYWTNRKTRHEIFRKQ